MALVNVNAIKRNVPFTGEYGNASKAVLTHTTSSNVNGDTVALGIIPGGSVVDTVRYNLGAYGASVTGTIGFQKVNASGSLVDDPDYWKVSGSVATATSGISSVAPKRFDEDVYVVLVFGGANPADGIVADVVVDYVFDLKDPA